MRLWESIKLADLSIHVGSGATPTGGKTTYHHTGIPLILSMNVHFDGFRKDGLVFLDETQAKGLDGARVQAGDVLLNITGASIGRVTIAPEAMEGARVNQHVCIIRPKSVLNSGFLAHFLASPEMQSTIGEQQVGATRQALTKSMILGFDIGLPSFAEQGRIVDEIEKQFTRLDAGVAALKWVEANLRRYKAAVLKAAVEGRLTERWRAEHPNVEPASELLKRILTERRRRWELSELAKMQAKGKLPTDDRWKKKYREARLPDTKELPQLPVGWCWATVDVIAFVTKLAGFEYTRYVRYSDDGDLPVIKAENAGPMASN
ncbi:MAG: restriction endonuclease subunit S [Planctomycetes bacterium]|nr:restriction endonuclease subunit S [Planctomycetota bacterium]MBI3835503.1 restriction endonuclease subunit S [Planctomycetota bacterium]